ncbi:hypothetical protein LOD99_2831 [Oopsacas minuta]|uniref:Uncharacterized protein n=1 Tax=Oopsacas minuta TaxID=111878 RepID=A0AAV7K1Y3_9METZ|nr:hypothetical protein LOD99_2831 [Oopsacas minuta]
MSESSIESVSDELLTGSTKKELTDFFHSQNFTKDEVSELLISRKRIKSKIYTRKSRALYRERIKTRELQKCALENERTNLLREIAFWQNAVYYEYNDDVFISPIPALN